MAGNIVQGLLDAVDGRIPVCDSLNNMKEICQTVENSRRTFAPTTRQTKSEVFSG